MNAVSVYLKSVQEPQHEKATVESRDLVSVR
jgi:hypothetical protein